MDGGCERMKGGERGFLSTLHRRSCDLSILLVVLFSGNIEFAGFLCHCEEEPGFDRNLIQWISSE